MAITVFSKPIDDKVKTLSDQMALKGKKIVVKQFTETTTGSGVFTIPSDVKNEKN